VMKGPRSLSRRRYTGRHVVSIGVDGREQEHQRLPRQSVRSRKTYADVAGTETKLQPDEIDIVHNFVTFYFSNVSDNISYSSLRKGFEVCGSMEDVYLARKHNVNGAVFGFVRYSKVKDVDKLLKDVNNVWFGDCKVVAKVSTYDRYGKKRGEGSERGEDAKK